MTNTTSEASIRFAAEQLLARLAHMTSEEFAHGGEMVERRALAVALGLDPDELPEPLDTPAFGVRQGQS